MDVLLFVNSKSFATIDDNIFTSESKCCIGNQNIESDTVFDKGVVHKFGNASFLVTNPHCLQ